MGESLHTGHRERMRERFLNDPDSFADHELLELLLYYALPRCDTNDTAHRLIEEFGSLSAVLEAEQSALCRVAGIGPTAAQLLRAAGEAARRYACRIASTENESTVFDTPDKIARFMYSRYIGINVERAYVLLFDNAMRLLDCFHVGDGSISSVPLSVRRIAQRAYEKQAVCAVLVHNHPNGIAYPSRDDVRVTERLSDALRLLEVPLVEHFILAGNRYYTVFSHRGEEAGEICVASPLADLIAERNKARSAAQKEDGKGKKE